MDVHACVPKGLQLQHVESRSSTGPGDMWL